MLANIRRKYLSDTFGQPTTEEMLLDQEIAKHLSYKNLFHTSKLVKEQQETLKKQ